MDKDRLQELVTEALVRIVAEMVVQKLRRLKLDEPACPETKMWYMRSAEKVISASTVARCPSHSVLQVKQGCHITQLAKDVMRTRKIRIEFEPAEPKKECCERNVL